MCEDEKKILKEIYDEFLQEKEDENKNIKKNSDRIEEIEVYLNSVRDDVDFKVFSPRSAENVFSDKIKEMEEEKIIIQDENKNHYHKLNQLNKKIEQLEKLLTNNKSLYNSNDIKVLDIQEKERQRIARELHDSSVQNLTHLVHTIELSSMFIDQDTIRAKLELENCIKILKDSINEIRETIFNLRPMSFDDLGFQKGIDDLILNAKSQFKDCEITYDVCKLEDEFLKTDKQEVALILVTIYRIIQEALMNALKHSHADKIILNVKSENKKCLIIVKDNGQGFSLEEITNQQKDKHFGISIMTERVNLLGGKIIIDSKPEEGTEIKVEIPLT